MREGNQKKPGDPWRFLEPWRFWPRAVCSRASGPCSNEEELTAKDARRAPGSPSEVWGKASNENNIGDPGETGVLAVSLAKRNRSILLCRGTSQSSCAFIVRIIASGRSGRGKVYAPP